MTFPAGPEGSRPLIVFSHGNSFPADTYRVLFGHLQERGYEVAAVDKFGHDPRYPVTSNWPHLVQQLADFTATQVKRSGQAPFLVGHSLGGYLSLMCAAMHPVMGGRPVRGVLLLDSPLVGGWRAAALGLAKRTGLVGSVPPGAVSRRRKHQWPDQAEALNHFRSKKMFAQWHDDVLQDYVEHGTHEAQQAGGGQRMLSFDREVETAIYNTLPHNLVQLLKRHPLQCPVAFIGGRLSAEIRQAGMGLTRQVTHGRISMLDGSHLFPMEKPLVTAASVDAALLNLASIAGSPAAPHAAI